jgi:hypothetical protein
MIYASKIDWWLGVILGVAGFGFCAMGIAAIADAASQPGLPGFASLFGLLPLALGLLICWQLAATRYEIGNSNLILRSGPFRWTIPLEQITQVYSTRDPPPHAPAFTFLDYFRANHPALSLDRLRIDYQQGRRTAFYLISPEDQAGFLKDLARAAPQLRG